MWTAKIQRAKEHQHELANEVARFFNIKPYQVGIRVDPDTERLIYYVQSVTEVPEKIPLIVGDIIQNLRSALDQLAYRLFIKNSSDTNLARSVYFPIAKDFPSYAAKKQRYTKGMSTAAQALIDRVQPYGDNNNELWQIHELNIIDKHRSLVTVGSTFQSLDIGAVAIASMRALLPDKDIPPIPLFIKSSEILFPLASGMELFIDAPKAKPNPEMQFRFNIVFNEIGIIEGKPVVKTLQSMIDTVESLKQIFSSEL